MKLSELNKNYYFHDSTILNLCYCENSHTLAIDISFCAWMQDNYKKDQPEIITMHLAFETVTAYTSDDSDFCDVDILQVNQIDCHTLEFVTQDDNRECYIFRVQATNVEITID